MRKAVVIVVLLAAVGFVGWRVYAKLNQKGNGATTKRTKAAVAVVTAPVRTADIRDVRVLTGTLEANAQFTVAPKVAGRLEKLSVDIGDQVKPGQVIARLESEEYVQKVEQARAELEVAKAAVAQCRSALEVAGRERDRVRELRRKQVSSESELDAVESEHTRCDAQLKVALAQVTQREAALKAADVQLSYTRIAAVWDTANPDEVRHIGERSVDEGAMLRANDPIVTVLALNPIRGVVHIIERDYGLIQIGQSAEITCDAYAGRRFSGKIVRIAPMMRESSRQAKVEIDIPNPDLLLKPGMFMRVHLELAQRTQATVVSSDALARRAEKMGVFLVDREQKTVKYVPVEVGILNGADAEIVSPSLSGEVVTMGQHLLEDGSAVLLPEASAGDSGKPAQAAQSGEKANRGGGPR